jgi:hypothetical protein
VQVLVGRAPTDGGSPRRAQSKDAASSPAHHPHAEDRAVRPPGLLFSLSILGLVALGSATLSCASGGPQSARERHLGRIEQGPGARVTADGLNRVETPPDYGVLYVKAPRPHLYRYHGIVLAPLNITYKRGLTPWSHAVEDRLRDRFATALEQQLEDHTAWELVDSPGPGVLVLIISALEIDVSAVEERVIGARTTHAVQSGEAILMVDLRDSQSGVPLTRFIQKHALPGGMYSGTDVEYKRVRRAFDRFAHQAAVTVEQLRSAAQEIQAEETAPAP